MKPASNAEKIFRVLLIFVSIVLFLAFLYPFVLVILNSLKNKKTILKDPLLPFEPGGPVFANYSNAIDKMRFPLAFTNSLVITVLSILLILLFSSMTAYLFVRTKWKFNKIVFAGMVASMVIPFQTLMIPLVSLYGATLNMLNHRLTLIYMYVGFGVSMAIFIYHGFIKVSVPISLEEAAQIDGANKLQTFFIVVLPLLRNVTSALVVLDALWIWNDYLLPSLILGEKNLYTLPLSTFAFYNTYTVDYGGIMAALMLTITPVLLLFIFLQKQVMNGIVTGAVK